MTTFKIIISDTYVKFTFSEKATKIDKIFTVKSMVKISSIFVAFLENMNFTFSNKWEIR